MYGEENHCLSVGGRLGVKSGKFDAVFLVRVNFSFFLLCSSI